MYYYLCVKEPEHKENIYVNMFITYSFGNSTLSQQSYNGNEFSFSLGYIYRTSVKNIIKDSNGRPYSIEKVSEYLRPYEFKLDEDAVRLITLKSKKGDTIKIHPIKVNDNGMVTYECECRTTDKKNILRSYFVMLTMPQADVIRECYRIVRKLDNNTMFWRNFFNKEIRDYNMAKRMGMIREL
jgi:hypothetical protein